MAYPIVILGSGRGSNAEALLKAEASKKLGAARIAAVVSDVEEARILSLGQKFKVPAIYMDPGKPGPRLSQEAEEAYIERIESFSPKLIVLAGFMRILRAKFIEAFEGRVINLHPSLLPSFKGSHAVKDAFDFGVKITGCTVHWVTPALDA
ncbi:MAG TPA: formyltransferase family protein, partial [Opitutales bacterium]|nr:formyltransferase family protein [Opitutales bacterium]